MPPNYNFQTTDYPQCQIIHIQSGRLFLKEGSLIRKLEPGWTIILFPRTAFQLFCRDIGYTGIGILHASGQADLNEQSRTAAIPPDERLDDLFKIVYNESRKGGNRNDLMIAAARFLEAAVYTRALPLLQAKLPTLSQWLERTRDMLARSTHEKFNLRERLSTTPVSYAHLSRRFRVQNGITLKRFVLQQKIKQAQAMLADRQMRITDIAYELGFSSSQHFAICFRNFAKLTPSTWRKKYSADLSGH
ncbi:MAG: AraC family transcriptional regulator [Verrucomicrobiota bacterium]